VGDSRPTLWEINRYFLILGATGFGGPVALANYMHRDLVERRHHRRRRARRYRDVVLREEPTHVSG
jgi:hypothetical protein